MSNSVILFAHCFKRTSRGSPCAREKRRVRTVDGGEGGVWRALGLEEKLHTGFAKLSARPTTFGDETVAVLIPTRLGPWRARLECDLSAFANDSVHSMRSDCRGVRSGEPLQGQRAGVEWQRGAPPAKMFSADVLRSCARKRGGEHAEGGGGERGKGGRAHRNHAPQAQGEKLVDCRTDAVVCARGGEIVSRSWQRASLGLGRGIPGPRTLLLRHTPAVKRGKTRVRSMDRRRGKIAAAHRKRSSSRPPARGTRRTR